MTRNRYDLHSSRRYVPTWILNFRSAMLSFSSRGERLQPGKVVAFIWVSISSSSLIKRKTAFDMEVDTDAGRAEGIFVRGPLLLDSEFSLELKKVTSQMILTHTMIDITHLPS